ncbi:MAG: ThuA domain-containing protein [Verrucomicrobiales bacterium]|nr:ThuA domain-containing protein [Verrucomicrobiales bacterium]
MIKTVLPLAACALLGSLSTGVAQDNKKPAPKTWPENALAKFKGNPTADHKAQIESNLPKATAEPKKDRKILCFWRCEGFIHTSIPFCNHAVEKIAETTEAYQVDLADDYSVFTDENLKQYDAIMFNNTTNLVPDEAQQKAILNFVNGGKGIIGVHAAADNFKKWEDGIAMIGGVFAGHPWTAGGTWAFKLDDPEHPLNAAFKGSGFWHKDEIYWYKPENFQGRERLRVLLSLDMSKPKNHEPLKNKKFEEQVAARGELDIPVSWIREIGEGRLFFTNLGHNDLTFANQTVLQHLIDGMQYAMGDIEADAVPSNGLKIEPALAPEEAPKKK